MAAQADRSMAGFRLVLSRLDQHAARRAEGRPTVSALVGDIHQADECWNSWTGRCGNRSIRCEWPSPLTIHALYTDRLLEQRDLVDDVLAALGRHTGRLSEELHREWSARTAFERHLWLDRLGLAARSPMLDCLCRRVLEIDVPAVTASGLQRVDRDALQARLGWNDRQVFEALCQLIPSESQPALLCPVYEAGAPERFSEAAETLHSLADAVPWLTIALAATPAAFAAWLRHGSETRAKALLRQGAILLPARTERESFVDASRMALQAQPNDQSPTLPVDPARSAAERFLFHVLESTSATTGLFALNVRLDFRFGGMRPAEIDLACAALKLAVEIDGHHHFQDADAYRRDRRKDVELQTRGWLVLRFLAEDVVTQQEQIIGAITDAVALRRRQAPQTAEE